jgi:flagellin
VIAEIQNQVGSGVVVAAGTTADTVTFTAATAGAAGTAAVAMGGTDASGSATTAGADAVAGTPANYTLAAGEFSVQVGTATAVDVTGTFASGQELADAINSSVSGVYASFNTTSNTLSITGSEDITLAGGEASGSGNLNFASLTNAVAGSLSTQNVLSVAGANSAIQSVDAALTSVSTLRSTLGAIQNRFQSVINSLQAVSENLSASRSRVLDTDFAAETASLTRAQILQQAGTAMVAQANSAPQNVLSLLRG